MCSQPSVKHIKYPANWRKKTYFSIQCLYIEIQVSYEGERNRFILRHKYHLYTNASLCFAIFSCCCLWFRELVGYSAFHSAGYKHYTWAEWERETQFNWIEVKKWAWTVKMEHHNIKEKNARGKFIFWPFDKQQQLCMCVVLFHAWKLTVSFCYTYVCTILHT